MKKQFEKFCEFVGGIATVYVLIALFGAGIGVFVGAMYIVTMLIVNLM